MKTLTIDYALYNQEHLDSEFRGRRMAFREIADLLSNVNELKRAIAENDHENEVYTRLLTLLETYVLKGES